MICFRRIESGSFDRSALRRSLVGICVAVAFSLVSGCEVASKAPTSAEETARQMYREAMEELKKLEKNKDWVKEKEDAIAKEERPSKARQMLLKLKEEKKSQEAKEAGGQAGKDQDQPHPKQKERNDRGGSSGSNA